MVHHRLEVAAVVHGLIGRGVGEGLGRNEVFAPNGHAIQAMLLRGVVDQAVNGIGNVRATRTAVGRHRNGVGEVNVGRHVQGWHLVGPTHGDGQVARPNVGAEVNVIGANIHLVFKAQGQDATLRVQGDVAMQAQCAAMPVADKNLGARPHPAHRALEQACGQHHQRVLAVSGGAQPKRTAHIVGVHLHAFMRPARDVGQKARHAAHALGGGVHMGDALGLIVPGPHRAWLHGRTHQPLAVDIDVADKVRLGKCSVHRCAVTGFEFHRGVARCLRVQLRRARGNGIGIGDHRVEGVVINLRQLGRILRLQSGVGHHPGHGLAHVQHLVVRQHRHGAHGLGLALWAFDLRHIGQVGKACGLHIFGRQHQVYARCAAHRAQVHAGDARMGVG